MNREATDLAGVRHIVYETLGSTNAEALARARAGERGPLWITAKTQSAGRGRRGSQWVASCTGPSTLICGRARIA
jgi:BirA family biotin operon repressor/biotin-[acetyl-CoA-carboxylase] ligase